MKESPNRQTVIVGLFVAFALVVLTAGILTVGSINDAFTHKVRVSAVFPDVGGLQVGDNVWFSGLKVGTVKHLGFETASEVEVDLAVDRAAAAHIPANALAKIGSDGLIGNKIVVLYEGTSGGPVLTDGDVLQVGASVSMEQMKEMLQQNNENLLAITTNLKSVTDKLAAGEGTAGKLLGDDQLYGQIQTTVATLASASAHADALTSSLNTFAGKLNEPGHLPNDLATDTELFTSLTASVNDLKQVGDHANSLVTSLQQGVADPNTPVGTLVGDHQAGADLKTTLSNLNLGSKALTDDLDALQHNLLLRGYFKKKEKEEPPAPEGPPLPPPPPAPAPKP